jgi:hypothetical protein
VRSLAAASKAVLTNAAIIVATVDQLDLQDILGLALLSKKRVDHGASALTDVVDPILVDELV